MTNRFEPVTIRQACAARTRELLMVANVHVRPHRQTLTTWFGRGRLAGASLVQTSRSTGGRI
ncbi:MAG: hypothetical protein QOG54_1610 [Actinomycetota bacterium]|jgi:hypothetical protein|nr:hypothetical protein [Actinomycetota bacterium]